MNLLIDEVELKVEWNTMIIAKNAKPFLEKYDSNQSYGSNLPCYS